MKRTTLIAIFIAVLVLIAGFGYLGHQAGYREALGTQKATLVGSLDALERIRAGDIGRGTALAEEQCFLSAVLLLGDDHYRSDVGVRSIARRLISYRQTYRTNQSEWTPLEQGLESLLAQKP